MTKPSPIEDAMARVKAGELLGPGDMAAIFKIKYSRFNALDKQHAWDQFKVRPALGPKCYSGQLVAKYLAGEPLYVSTFGRKRATR